MVQPESSDKSMVNVNRNGLPTIEPPPYSGAGGVNQNQQAPPPGTQVDAGGNTMTQTQEGYTLGTGFEFGNPPTWLQSNYNAQFNQGQKGNVIESILAVQTLLAAFKPNGRNPVTVVCPFCKSTATTQVTELENANQVARAAADLITMRLFFCGTGIASLIFLGLIAIFAGSIILVLWPGILIFLMLAYYVTVKGRAAAAMMSKDIEHRCSVCKTLLGFRSQEAEMSENEMKRKRLHLLPF